MNESFNPISAIGFSFYSADFYRAAARWRGKALVTLGVVLAVCWLPIMIQTQLRLNQFFQKAETQLLPTIPDIRFERGVITTTENRPYVFHLGEGSQAAGIIIDTSGQYTSLDGQKAQILVTRSACYLRQRTGEVRVYDLSKSRAKPIALNQEVYKRLLKLIRRWAPFLLFFAIAVMSFLKRLIQAFFLALMGLGICAALEVDLDLGELLSLAIVSMIPAMILETLVALSGARFPMQWVFAGGVILAYFIFAINVSSGPSVPDDGPLLP